MAILPKQDKITPKQERESIIDEPRPYLGMSQIGNSCKRATWYYFRWVYRRSLTQRELRIFERGDLEEPRVLRDLAKWGWEIISTQEDYSDIFGHFRGHSDGVVKSPAGEVMILEIKTMNDKAFADLQKKGLRLSKPLYFAQAQMYMHYSQHKKVLFVILNKNTEARIYCEEEYDKSFAEDLISTAEDIIVSDTPPDKIGGPSWFECKFCPAYEVCHFGEHWVQTCRTCVNAEIHNEGRWYCTEHAKFITAEDQRKGCERFTVIPAGSRSSSE